MSDKNFFKDFGYLYFKDVLTEYQRLRFASIMLILKQHNSLTFEGINSKGERSNFYNNSYGGNHPEFESALISVQSRVENEIGIKLRPKNTYARIYYNGGEMNKHIDRKGLDYTLSICLFNNLNQDWPLWCIDGKNNHVPINIKAGDGAMMLGSKLTHWREPLVCSDNKFLIQLFMHWEAY